MPGSGSLIAGRWIGYFQIVLALLGLGVTLFRTIQVFIWYLQNYRRINESSDPLAGLFELGHQLVKPAAGFAIFAVAILWGVVTSWSIIRGTVKR